MCSLLFQSERPYYVELNPSHSSIAEAISKMFRYNFWNSTCLLIQNDFKQDTFEQTLRDLSQKNRWRIENSVQFDSNDSKESIHKKVDAMQENECTILIVHTDVPLAKKIFEAAKKYRLLGQGYAWLLTDAAYSSSKSTLSKYPTGTISFKLTKQNNLTNVISVIGKQLTRSVAAFRERHGNSLKSLAQPKTCWNILNFSSPDLHHPSSLFQR